MARAARRRAEGGDQSGGVHSSQSDSADAGSAPSRFQTQFADLVRDAAGTDEFRAEIIGALDKMGVYHEAFTGIGKMVAAMRSIEELGRFSGSNR